MVSETEGKPAPKAKAKAKEKAVTCLDFDEPYGKTITLGGGAVLVQNGKEYKLNGEPVK